MVSRDDVTIIIPAYCENTEQLLWLDECIESALKQGCKVIACDDFSPLRPYNVFVKYRKKMVGMYSTQHFGVSATRNAAITAADTELILPLDSDDRLVDGALEKLLEYWDGETPVYPDIRKFGTEEVPHYALLDFDCDHIFNYVGFTSVNVLHRRDQWQDVGGYNKDIDFYEDGEYNAKLLCKYGGIRCPYPLVEYRMHPNQRTKRYAKEASIYAKRILNQIRRNLMPCAGCGKRKTKSNFEGGGIVQGTFIQDPTNMPLEQGGMVLAQYVGGQGRGKHYYQGLSSKILYRVTYGVYVYVKSQDTRAANDAANPSMLIKYERKSTAKAVSIPSESEDMVERTAVKPKKKSFWEP